MTIHKSVQHNTAKQDEMQALPMNIQTNIHPHLSTTIQQVYDHA
jgi:hypothetical protein